MDKLPKSSYSYANDLRHAIQVEHSMELSDKAYSAILQTIQDAQYEANRQKTEEMCYWRQMYYAKLAEEKELIGGIG